MLPVRLHDLGEYAIIKLGVFDTAPYSPDRASITLPLSPRGKAKPVTTSLESREHLELSRELHHAPARVKRMLFLFLPYECAKPFAYPRLACAKQQCERHASNPSAPTL